MKVYICDVCKNEVQPEDLRYLVYGMFRSIPALTSASSLKSVEGHGGCLARLAEAMPS